MLWTAGLSSRVDAWELPPLERMTRLFLEMTRRTSTFRIANDGRVPLAPLVRVHEVRQGGPVMADDNLKFCRIVL